MQSSDSFPPPGAFHEKAFSTGTLLPSQPERPVPGSGGSAELLRPDLPQRTASVGSDGRLLTVPGDGSSACVDFRSVIKVLATVQQPDYLNPWQTERVQKVNGSGVAFIAGNRQHILTAAHVVAHQTFVQVQRTGVETPDKHVATVHAISHECDLAILDVEDPSFWEGLDIAKLGTIPEIRSIVLVAGFPVGGGELSVTEGVVSRIEDQVYCHSKRRLLAATVDAAMNAGISGGPVFNLHGELVGIAFQELQGFSNIGYIIPPPVIEHFLEGVARWGPNGYRGFPGTGFEDESIALENPYLRKHLSLADDIRGVLVTKVLCGQTCDGILQRFDVITHVDSQAVANNGTIGYGKYGRVKIAVAFSMKQIGSPIELKIVRNGKPMMVTATAKPYQRLVPLRFAAKRPPFFVYCGLVFQPLSYDYIEFSAAENPNFVSLFFTGRQEKDWKRAIILSQVLNDKVNLGYEALENEKILKVNGEKVTDLADLVHKIESTTKPTVRLETCCDDLIVLPSPAEAKVSNERIMFQYQLGSDRHLEED